MITEIIESTATFTRPANTTSYTALDVVSNNATTTTLMTFYTGMNKGSITKVNVKTSNPLWVGTKLRIWLTNNPAYAVVGDNVALNQLSTVFELGYIDSVLFATGTACATCGTTCKLPFISDSNLNVYGYVQIISGVLLPTSGQTFAYQITSEKI